MKLQSISEFLRLQKYFVVPCCASINSLVLWMPLCACHVEVIRPHAPPFFTIFYRFAESPAAFPAVPASPIPSPQGYVPSNDGEDGLIPSPVSVGTRPATSPSLTASPSPASTGNPQVRRYTGATGGDVRGGAKGGGRQGPLLFHV